jgi:hypothetical protein
VFPDGQAGAQVVLRVYANNDARAIPEVTSARAARGVRARFYLPTYAATTMQIEATLGGTNVSTVWDSLHLIGSQPFKIDYVPGSAKLVRGNLSYALSDDIVTGTGALIGGAAMDGVLPASSEQREYAAWVEIVVNVHPQSQPQDSAP